MTKALSTFIVLLAVLVVATSSETTDTKASEASPNDQNAPKASQPNQKTLWTNERAFACFQNQGMKSCQRQIYACINDQACVSELQAFIECQFDVSSSAFENIFNGYCFRRWTEKAKHTHATITCFNRHCFMGTYNAIIGVKQLYECSRQTLLDNKVVCEENCEKEIEDKIRSKLTRVPIEQLYQQQMVDSQAQIVVGTIYRQCVSAEAPTRKALENEWDEKKDKKGNQSEKPEPIKQTGQIDPSIEVDPIKQNKPSAGVEQVQQLKNFQSLEEEL